jgi:hypothetical protein
VHGYPFPPRSVGKMPHQVNIWPMIATLLGNGVCCIV